MSVTMPWRSPLWCLLRCSPRSPKPTKPTNTLPVGREFADLGPHFTHVVHGAIVDAVSETNATIKRSLVSQMRVLHSRDVLRPARITFGVLDVEATTPGKDGWDIQGVLIGKQARGEGNWYVFLVGIVARTGYRPISIEDIRLVGFWARAGKLAWEMSPANHLALQRYRDTYRESVPVRFPEDTDQFSMSATEDHVSVRELQSGADWSLRLDAGNSDTGGQTATRVCS
jgi:hypothetical protein